MRLTSLRPLGLRLLAAAALITMTTAVPVAATVPSQLAAETGYVVCDDDGTSGRRVQLLYVRGEHQADRYGQFSGQFQGFADTIDKLFVEAAWRTGGVRHLRFATGADCRPTVDNVVLPKSDMADWNTITNALKARGYDRADRKYTFFYEQDGCGLAYGNGGDNRPGSDNPINAGPHYAAMGTGCWKWEPTGHEILHTLGAVHPTAPHASKYGHCWDDEDIMCYDDGGLPPGGLKKECPGAPENQIDCKNDDYFHVKPPAGSYLATNWNVANSDYLYKPEPGAAVKDGSTYLLVNAGTLKSADVLRGSAEDGAKIIQYTKHGAPYQQWKLRKVDSYWELSSVHSGKCLGVVGGSKEPVAEIEQRKCTSATSQQWKLERQKDGAYTVVNRRSKLMLQPYGDFPNNLTSLIQGNREDNAGERWLLQPVG